jgi:hypothetical protein
VAPVAGKRSLRRQLRGLADREQQQRRDLGELILEMYRRDEFDQQAVERRSSELAALQREVAALRRQLGIEPQPAAEHRPRVVVRKAQPETEIDSATESAPPATEATERRVREAAEGARRGAEEQAAAEILALEKDLEREQQRAATALEQLQRQIQETEQRLGRADSERDRDAAEARSAAAAWLRGQARAMRREAERQVRAELSGNATPAPDDDARERIGVLEAAKAEAEQALAEMTRRSNEANARAQKAEAAAEMERQERSRVLQAAEQRLTEIEEQAIAASERIDAAERQLAEEAERIRVDAEERIRNEVETARRRFELEKRDGVDF